MPPVKGSAGGGGGGGASSSSSAKVPKSVAAGLEQPAHETRDLPFSYTTFSVPPPVNAKNAASQYIRNEGQGWSGRNNVTKIMSDHAGTAKRSREERHQEAKKARGEEVEDEYESDIDMDEEITNGPSLNTIVIHPGSTHLRLGLSTDLNPVTVPHTLARRDALTAFKSNNTDKAAENGEETATRVTEAIDTLRNDLRSIMRNMKLRGMANGKQQAANYNANVTPEQLDEHQDVFAIEWTDESQIQGDVATGEMAEKLACFSSEQDGKGQSRPWQRFGPFKAGHLNFEDYTEHYGESAARCALMADIQAIWSHALSAPRESEMTKDSAGSIADKGLGIPKDEWANYNVSLIISDLYIMSEIEALVELLLNGMGFASVMLQQEGVCATFGAGLSSACVVHIGSTHSSITCVDEGLVVGSSRLALGYGGEQLSRFFIELLQRANLPYKDFDFDKRLADKWLANELKERLCTLDVTQMGLVISDFHVRLPKQPTFKYTLRTYDEVVIAAMALFNSEAFRDSGIPQRFLASSAAALVGDDDETEQETFEGFPITPAMRSSVRHLLPAAPTTNGDAPMLEANAGAPLSKQASPALPTLQLASSPPVPVAVDANEQQSKTEGDEPTVQAPPEEAKPSATPRESPVATKSGLAAENGSSVPTLEETPGNGEEKQASVPSINIPHESSKTHLHSAVWNSIVAGADGLGNVVASEERIKRMITNILLTGGTSLLPGVGVALEVRLNNFVAALWTAQQKDIASAPHPTVVPPPRDMDPRIVPWKGMAVLSRLDNVADMWVLRQEWQTFGMRAVREKSYFLL